jgi:DNA-binding NtrC family response regulator
MENGAFRRDLYYRLNVVEIRVVALRERRLDIPVLLGHFLQRAADAHARRLRNSPLTPRNCWLNTGGPVMSAS